MVDKNGFMEILHEVTEIASVSESKLSEEEILGYFKDLELSEEQKKLVIHYIQNPASDERKENSDFTKEKKENLMPIPNTNFFRLYKEDLKNISLRTEKEEQLLYERLAGGGQEIVPDLTEQWMERVFTIARKKAKKPEQLQDLIQEGNLAVVLMLHQILDGQILQDYNYEIKNAVENAMELFLIENNEEEDKTKSILAKATLVQEAKNYLAEELQRVPSNEELETFTKLSREELENIERIVKEK